MVVAAVVVVAAGQHSTAAPDQTKQGCAAEATGLVCLSGEVKVIGPTRQPVPGVASRQPFNDTASDAIPRDSDTTTPTYSSLSPLPR